MYTKDILRSCDMCNEKDVAGFHFFARGATGRVCNVLDICHTCDTGGKKFFRSEDRTGYVTLEEVKAWAESVPNGYLDY